jgi:hypothetical protein
MAHPRPPEPEPKPESVGLQDEGGCSLVSDEFRNSTPRPGRNAKDFAARSLKYQRARTTSSWSFIGHSAIGRSRGRTGISEMNFAEGTPPG